MSTQEPGDIRSVQPGDTVIFQNRGKQFGGVVWRAPSTGDLLAGDTFLTVRGEWVTTDEHVVRIIRKQGDHSASEENTK
jgi:hypothetical protein